MTAVKQESAPPGFASSSGESALRRARGYGSGDDVVSDSGSDSSSLSSEASGSRAAVCGGAENEDLASGEAPAASLSDPRARAGSLSDCSSVVHTDESDGSSVGPLWGNTCLQSALVSLFRTAKERRAAKAYFAEVCANNSCAGVAVGAVERQNFEAVLAFAQDAFVWVSKTHQHSGWRFGAQRGQCLGAML